MCLNWKLKTCIVNILRSEKGLIMRLGQMINSNDGQMSNINS